MCGMDVEVKLKDHGKEGGLQGIGRKEKWWELVAAR